MSSPLNSVRLTVRHAKDHIAELDLLTEAFFDTDPYEMVIEPDPLYPGRKIQYARIAKPLPYRIPGLASDAAVNLRSALDHIGFICARHAGGNGKKAYFPFADTLAEVKAAARIKGPSEQIPKPIFDYMVACQPYEGGNDTLWRLNKIANTNKHEVTLAAILFANQIHVSGRGFELMTGPRNSVDSKIPIQWIIPGETQLDKDIQLTGTIKFNDFGKLTFDEPAFSFLNDSARVVERIISGVEAESIRLKFF
jgi:hypothetical protein